jgi:signal-transduction protein with cAMP-binding, CBS, and nucleotidyltransferase domain
MLSAHVHRLVVTQAAGDQRRPIGILSMTDLARVTEHLT